MGSTGDVFIADVYNNRIRKVDSLGVISAFAGTGLKGFIGDGGAASAANMTLPFGVTASPNGDIYIADTYNHRIRKVRNAMYSIIKH